MKQIQSFFYRLFKESPLVLVEGVIWNIENEQKNENYFRWYTRKFGVAKYKELRHLEEDYLEKHRGEIEKSWNKVASGGINCKIDQDDVRLGDFALNDLIRKRKERRSGTRYTLDELLNKKYAFVCQGEIFDLTKQKSKNHEIRINKTSYSIGKQITEIECLEGDYVQAFGKGLNCGNLAGANKIRELLLRGGFYDRKTNIGFEKTAKGFFVYTLVEPYALYETRNKKYYSFGEAKVGIRIWLVRDEITWQDAVVMNNYIHPALARQDEYQRICTGNFSYSTIRNKYESKADQIKIALQKAMCRFMTFDTT